MAPASDIVSDREWLPRLRNLDLHMSPAHLRLYGPDISLIYKTAFRNRLFAFRLTKKRNLRESRSYDTLPLGSYYLCSNPRA